MHSVLRYMAEIATALVDKKYKVPFRISFTIVFHHGGELSGSNVAVTNRRFASKTKTNEPRFIENLVM